MLMASVRYESIVLKDDHWTVAWNFIWIYMKEIRIFMHLESDVVHNALSLAALLPTLVTIENTNSRETSKYLAPKGLKIIYFFLL